MNWHQTTLGALIDQRRAGLQTGPFGTALHASSYTTDGTPVVAVKNIGDNRIDDEDIPRIGPADAGRLAKYQLATHDILFSRKGAVERRALVREHEAGWLQGSDCIRLRLDETVADPVFVSFVMGSRGTQSWLKANAHGATMPSLNQEILRRLPIPLPPIEEQRAIASVLGAFDDKIELNRRMSETLEALARAIFTSWFVDFDPVRAKAEGRQPVGMDAEKASLFPDSFEDSPLGPIPSGWTIGGPERVVSLSRTSIDPSEHPDEPFDHHSLPAFDDGKRPRVELGHEIRSSKLIVQEGSVLLSRLNPRIQRVWLPAPRTARRQIASTEFLVVQPQRDAYREWLYCLFLSDAFHDSLAGLATGTSGSHQRARGEDVLAIPSVLAPDEPVKAFRRVAQPLLARVRAGVSESEALATARDALLPELISGAVRVR